MSATENLNKICDLVVQGIQEAGIGKQEKLLTGPQGIHIELGGQKVVNFSSCDYYGFSNHPEIIEAAKKAMGEYGFGVSSHRLDCGTQPIHKELENKIAEFHKKEDAIAVMSCFDVNAGIFDALLTSEDAAIYDERNHPSCAEGIKMTSAKTCPYRHLDMKHLEEILIETQSSRIRLIQTDGIFSTDVDFAPVDQLVALAKKYNAILIVDESHGCGVIGPTGRGVCEYFGLEKEVDVIVSSLGKALGGAGGGYITGPKEVIELVRQQGKIYKNPLSSAVVGGTLKAFEILEKSDEYLKKLHGNKRYFKGEMRKKGFNFMGNDETPISVVLVGEAKLTK